MAKLIIALPICKHNKCIFSLIIMRPEELEYCSVINKAAC